MPTLEKVLPVQIVSQSEHLGQELAMSLSDALNALRIATDHEIAVLGVEAYLILENIPRFKDYSEYEFRFENEWPRFVQENNNAAAEFLAQAHPSDELRYVLTAADREEFEKL